jgi:hypothetical protein
MVWHKNYLRFRRSLDTAFLRGWDSALIQPCDASNPYHRQDFRRAWDSGRKACLANKPLPEWAKQRAGKGG